MSYQAKAERADENQELIEAVFAELNEREHDVENPASLQAVPAFQAFVADIKDRCEIRPIAVSTTIVGGYNLTPKARNRGVKLRRAPGSRVRPVAVRTSGS